MARKAKGPGYTPRSGKTPIFKNMGSSPAKGKLDDLIKNFGAELRTNKKSVSDKYAEKKSRKAGESKFQADVRRRRETNKAKRSIVDEDKDGMSDFIQAPSKAPTGKETVSSNVDNADDWNDGSLNSSGTKRYNASTSSWEDYTPPKSSNKNETKFSASGTEARKKEYDAKKWKYDDTIKGYNRDGTEKKKKGKFKVQLMVGKQQISADELKKMSFGRVNKTKQGTEMYTYHSDDFGTQEEADIYMAKAKLSGFENAFIPKKSPAEKRSGFKMKSSPAKIFDAKGKPRKNYKY